MPVAGDRSSIKGTAAPSAGQTIGRIGISNEVGGSDGFGAIPQQGINGVNPQHVTGSDHRSRRDFKTLWSGRLEVHSIDPTVLFKGTPLEV